MRASRFTKRCVALAGAALLLLGTAISAQAQIFQGIYGAEREDAAEGGVIQTREGDFVAVGYSDSYGNDRDVYVVRIDRCGKLVWARTYDFGGVDVGRKIRETAEGNFVIVGSTENRFNCCTHDDAYLLEIEPGGGGVVWAYTFGGIYDDAGMDVQVDKETQDIYACGRTSSFGAGRYDAWIFKTDRTGALIWSRVYGGRDDDRLNSLTLGCSGTVIAAGDTRSAAPSEQILVVKANAGDGSLVGGWPKHYGYDRDESAWSVTAYGDDAIFIAGRTNHFGGINEEYVLGIKCEGGERFGDLAVWGTNGDGDDQFTEIQVLPDGNLVMTGFLQDNPNGFGGYDVHVFEMTPGFAPIVPQIIAYGSGRDDQGWSVAVTSPAVRGERWGLITAGWSDGFEGLGPRDVYVIRSTAGRKSGCNERKTEIRWESPKFDPQEFPSCDPQINVQCRAKVEVREVKGHRVLCSSCFAIAPAEEDPSLSQRVPSGNGDVPMNAAVAPKQGTYLVPQK